MTKLSTHSVQLQYCMIDQYLSAHTSKIMYSASPLSVLVLRASQISTCAYAQGKSGGKLCLCALDKILCHIPECWDDPNQNAAIHKLHSIELCSHQWISETEKPT